MSQHDSTLQAGIPEAEFHIDESLVKNLLLDQCPQYSHLPLQVLGNGWDNSLFRLGEELLVRLPRRQFAVSFASNEQRYLKIIAPRLPLPVPVPVYCGTPACTYPWPWSITPWIIGNTADKSPPHANSAKQWADFLRMLHYPASENAPQNPYRSLPLTSYLEKFEQRYQSLRDKNAINHQAVNAIWQTGLESVMAFSPCWIHGDLHSMNILCANGKFTGVIDWGDMCVGDSATDLASFWVLFDGQTAEHSIQHDYRASVAQIQRAKASAVLFALVLLDTGLDCNEQQVNIARTILNNLGAN